MCGICGFMCIDPNIKADKRRSVIRRLLCLSEMRGKESTGIASPLNDGISVLKERMPAHLFVKSEKYKDYEKSVLGINETVCIGHNRLATNGSGEKIENSHPIAKDGFAIAHNGIIVNDFAIWNNHGDWRRETELDSEIILKYLVEGRSKGNGLKDSLEVCFQNIYGASSICGIDIRYGCVFACTNVGSVYCWIAENNKTAILASEQYIIEKALATVALPVSKHDVLFQLKPYDFLSLDIHNGKISVERRKIKVRTAIPDRGARKVMYAKNWDLFHEIDADEYRINKLKRCTKCLLPETIPFIEFDETGVCNYCKKWIKPYNYGSEKLREWVREYKGKNSKILATLSGGRDSSFSLHYLKKELNMDVLAYSYDWGMVTDLARRNQARMCDKLGIEYIVVSADIARKRQNIKKNILAWLKRPSLGMVPLFMAGDKQYFYYANKIARQNNIEAICLSTNRYEITNFKYGFCGVIPPTFRKNWKKGTEQLPWKDVIKMAGYYAKEFMMDPSYFNQSLEDTIWAAISNYVIKHNYFRIYDYIDWDEKEIDKILIDEYDWEKSPYRSSTWRIGDGTAPFYNYIYYIMCGFTESDCLRSNQIRAGKITRREGEALIAEENKINFDEMEWYFNAINLNMYDVLRAINGFNKLY